MTKVFALQAANFLFLLDRFREHTSFCAFGQNVVVVVNVEDKIGAMLLGEGDAFVVNQAGVFNRIDSRANGIFDGLGAVGVCGNLPAEFVGFLGDGLQFFQRVLRRSRLIALAQDAAGCADLDDIGTVFDDFTNFGTSGPGSIGHTDVGMMKFVRE